MVNTASLKHFIASLIPLSKQFFSCLSSSNNSCWLADLLTCASPSAISRNPVSQEYCCSPMHSSDILSSKTNAASLWPWCLVCEILEIKFLNVKENFNTFWNGKVFSTGLRKIFGKIFRIFEALPSFLKYKFFLFNFRTKINLRQKCHKKCS